MLLLLLRRRVDTGIMSGGFYLNVYIAQAVEIKTQSSITLGSMLMCSSCAHTTTPIIS